MKPLYVSALVLALLLATLAGILLDRYSTSEPEAPTEYTLTQAEINAAITGAYLAGREDQAKAIMALCDSLNRFSYGDDLQYACSKMEKF